MNAPTFQPETKTHYTAALSPHTPSENYYNTDTWWRYDVILCTKCVSCTSTNGKESSQNTTNSAFGVVNEIVIIQNNCQKTIIQNTFFVLSVLQNNQRSLSDFCRLITQERLLEEFHFPHPVKLPRIQWWDRWDLSLWHRVRHPICRRDQLFFFFVFLSLDSIYSSITSSTMRTTAVLLAVIAVALAQSACTVPNVFSGRFESTYSTEGQIAIFDIGYFYYDYNAMVLIFCDFNSPPNLGTKNRSLCLPRRRRRSCVLHHLGRL